MTQEPVGNKNEDSEKIFSGRYKIELLIGEGGFAKVYRARNIEIGKIVALKVLQDRLADEPGSIERFQREAKTACMLNHPNLTTVFDFGVADNGQPYIVMEYLEGDSLHALLRRQQSLSWVKTLNLLIDICKGLDEIHAHNIVHRDVTPSNIMFCPDHSGHTQVKLLDYGLAKEMRSRAAHLTKTGELVGTPQYMSPEQCLERTLDPRSDIYALGCVAYEAVTGKPAFDGKVAVECMIRQIKEMPQAFQEVSGRAKIPDAFEAIVFKMLAKNPDERYANCQALLADLGELKGASDGALTNLVDALKRQRKASTSRPLSKRKSVQIGLAALVLSAAALSIGSFMINSHNQVAAPDQIIGEPDLAVLAKRWDDLERTGLEQYSRHDYLAAKSTFSKALNLGETWGDANPRYTESVHNYVDCLRLLKDPEEKKWSQWAFTCLKFNINWGDTDRNQQLISRFDTELKLNPNDLEIRRQLAKKLNDQARMLLSSKYEEAEALSKRAAELEKRLPPSDLEQLRTLIVLGTVQLRRADQEAAARTFGQISEWLTKYGDSKEINYGLAQDALASYHFTRRATTKARKYWSDAIKTFRLIMGDWSPQAAHAVFQIAEIDAIEGKHVQAQAGYDQALRVLIKTEGKYSIQVARLLISKGSVQTRQKFYAAAEISLNRALAILKMHQPIMKQDLASVYYALGNLCFAQNRKPEAAQYYSLALDAYYSLDSRSSEVSDLLGVLTRIYRDENDQGKLDSLKKYALKGKNQGIP